MTIFISETGEKRSSYFSFFVRLFAPLKTSTTGSINMVGILIEGSTFKGTE